MNSFLNHELDCQLMLRLEWRARRMEWKKLPALGWYVLLRVTWGPSFRSWFPLPSWPVVKNKGRIRETWMRPSYYAYKSSEPGYMPPPTTPFPTPNSLIKGWTWTERLTLFWLKGPAYIFWSSNTILCEIHSIWFWSFYTLNSEGKKKQQKTQQLLTL